MARRPKRLKSNATFGGVRVVVDPLLPKGVLASVGPPTHISVDGGRTTTYYFHWLTI
jgi:hypothetical protein